MFGFRPVHGEVEAIEFARDDDPPECYSGALGGSVPAKHAVLPPVRVRVNSKEDCLTEEDMHRVMTVGFCLAIAMGSRGLLYCGEDDAAFSLTATGPAEDIVALPGEIVDAEVVVTMDSVGLAPEDNGAQAWSISLSSQGWEITGVTTEGTTAADVTSEPPGIRLEGFEVSELTDGSARTGSDCEGRRGAVSAVVLSFVNDVTLPTDAPSDILIVSVSGEVPPEPENVEEDGCAEYVVEFVNGCTGGGQPVDNKITLGGITFRPERNSSSTRVCPIIHCGAPGRINITVTDTPADGEQHVSDSTEVPDDDAKFTVEVRAAETGSLTLYANIVSDSLDSGIQGWALAASVEGLLAVDATDTGTAAADAPDGFRDTGFHVGHTIDPEIPHPETGEPQGQGLVTATVLSFVYTIALPTSGTATVLCFTVQTAEPMGEDETVVGAVRWTQNLTGAGQPVSNIATLAGNSVSFRCCQTAQVCFVAPSRVPFIRCDPNVDGESNIADAIYLVNQLFRGGDATSCDDSADCNNDGQVDVSDATYSVAYRFAGGNAPPAPFPGCGLESETDEVEDELDCEEYLPCSS